LTIEAAVDFTGGIPELIDLKNNEMNPQALFHLMRNAYKRGAFMGCALGVMNNEKTKNEDFIANTCSI